jgi:hypothetical protein
MNATLLSLGLVVYSSYKAQTVYSLLMAVTRLPCPVHFNFQRGTYIHEAREHAVTAALAAGASHLMFVDSDVVFLADGIPRLLAHDKDIIGASYQTKELRGHATVMLRAKRGNYLPVAPLPPALFEADAVATGFMLIDLGALVAKWPTPPYFRHGVWRGELMGEDVHFCRQAKQRGLKVWCDPTIAVGHIGDYVF